MRGCKHLFRIIILMLGDFLLKGLPNTFGGRSNMLQNVYSLIILRIAVFILHN